VIIPAFKFLPDKDSGNMYWDGFQAEWRYDHGFKRIPDMIGAIKESLRELITKAKAVYPYARIALTNIVRLNQHELAEIPTEFLELGCMPSRNVYGMSGTHVDDPRTLPYRFAGAHMHFGFRKQPNYVEVVKTLDKILGVWSVAAAGELDATDRRRYYGLAGEHRLPKYGKRMFGLEYRVLSSFYLCDPAVTQAVWEIAKQCVNLSFSKLSQLWVIPQEEVISTINNCDLETARFWLGKNQGMFNWLVSDIEKDKEGLLLNMAMQGIRNIFPEPYDPFQVEGNWGIK
jgi:hypothetical protein